MGSIFGYSYASEAKHALAQGHDMDASYKDLVAVCANIKGKKVAQAAVFLDEAAVGKRAVRYHKHNKKMAHRSQLGGRKGRFPMKAVKLVRAVFKNAVANAEFRGLDAEKLMVAHAAANKQANYPRMKWQGRARRSDYETARVEICLEEK